MARMLTRMINLNTGLQKKKITGIIPFARMLGQGAGMHHPKHPASVTSLDLTLRPERNCSAPKHKDDQQHGPWLTHDSNARPKEGAPLTRATQAMPEPHLSTHCATLRSKSHMYLQSSPLWRQTSARALCRLHSAPHRACSAKNY